MARTIGFVRAIVRATAAGAHDAGSCAAYFSWRARFARTIVHCARELCAQIVFSCAPKLENFETNFEKFGKNNFNKFSKKFRASCSQIVHRARKSCSQIVLANRARKSFAQIVRANRDFVRATAAGAHDARSTIRSCAPRQKRQFKRTIGRARHGFLISRSDNIQ